MTSFKFDGPSPSPRPSPRARPGPGPGPGPAASGLAIATGQDRSHRATGGPPRQLSGTDQGRRRGAPPASPYDVPRLRAGRGGSRPSGRLRVRELLPSLLLVFVTSLPSPPPFPPPPLPPLPTLHPSSQTLGTCLPPPRPPRPPARAPAASLAAELRGRSGALPAAGLGLFSPVSCERSACPRHFAYARLGARADGPRRSRAPGRAGPGSARWHGVRSLRPRSGRTLIRRAPMAPALARCGVNRSKQVGTRLRLPLGTQLRLPRCA